MTKPVRYNSADDFGVKFTNEVGENVYDARTKMGPLGYDDRNLMATLWYRCSWLWTWSEIYQKRDW